MAVNNPYLLRTGLRLGVEVLPSRWVAVELDVGLYPDLGKGDWTPRLYTVADDGLLAPDLSRVLFQTRLDVRAEPLQAPLGKGLGTLGVFAGGGLVYTVDDYTLLDPADQPADPQLLRQAHPELWFGLTAAVRYRVAGFRVRGGFSYYRETVHPGEPHGRLPLWLGAEATFWLPQ